MRKAFESRGKLNTGTIRRMVPLFVTVLIIVFVVVSLQGISDSADMERLGAMEQAVRRSVVQCYAIEGRYPGSLEYLEENYGLMLNRDKYIYHYQKVGANLLPEIAVIPKV